MSAGDVLIRAGLPASAASWLGGAPDLVGDFARDSVVAARFWREGAGLFARLPAKPRRSAAEAEAAAAIAESGRALRHRFLAAHVEAIYRALTRDYAGFVRVDELAYEAAQLVPGLVPTRAEVTREDALRQGDKDGSEIDQGIFLAHVLAHPAAGTHLCRAMLLPLPQSAERLAAFASAGSADCGAATVTRAGRAAIVTMRNPRFLNAEDETTIDGLEAAVDLAILDGASDIAVLRGDRVEHAKWRGRRVFSSGINLTHLYHGKISYLWYIRRELGLVNKMLRGLARRDRPADEEAGGTIEKPWIAAVDGFAIGGGCQILLVMDYVLAAADAYLTLPARKEGIIPGAANLRLTRFTGGRIAREAILYGRRLDCDSAEGRLVCDEVVPPADMDRALAAVIDNFTSSGVVSAAGNRRAIRVGQEPFDLFRQYMAVYAREQAHCHFSPALIANLERHWNAQARSA